MTVPPTLRLGLLPPTNQPALKLGTILTGTVPDHPVAANHFRGRTFGLYENDRYSNCGPTGICNHLRMTSGAMLGTEIVPSQDDNFTLYKRCNPSFNPTTGEGDNGVVLQDLLAKLLAYGVGNGKGTQIKPIAYAKVDVDSEAELEAAASIFGAIWGVSLQQAQQAQSRQPQPVWTYDRSFPWGGHAVMSGKYSPGVESDVALRLTTMASTMTNPSVKAQVYQHVISWDEDVAVGEDFLKHQLIEAWVVVWPFMLTHPAFQAGVDLGTFRSAFRDLTGREIAA